MSRSAARVTRVIAPLLEPDETILESSPVWAVEARAHVPSPLLSRAQFLVAVTEQRFFVLPKRRGALSADDVVLTAHHDACRLVRFQRWTPMQALQLRMPDGRELIFEFCPRHRRVGTALAAAIPRYAPAPELTETHAEAEE